MKTIGRFIRTTLAGGVLFLLPIVVLLLLLGKALEIMRKLVLPLANRLPVESIIGLDAPKALAIVLLIFLCFIAGVLARSAAAKKTTNWLESAILSNLPGYEILKTLSGSLLGSGEENERPVVLARIEDSWQIGFVFEQLEAGYLAVFVPGTPDPKSGAVYLMGEDRVRRTDIPFREAYRCVKRYGLGARAMLRVGLEWPASDVPSPGSDGPEGG